MSFSKMKRRGHEQSTTKSTFNLEIMNKAVDLVLIVGYSKQKAAKMYELAHKRLSR